LGVGLNKAKLQAQIAAYKKLLAEEPRTAPVLNNLGVAFARLNRWQEAVECFNEALLVDSAHAGAQANLERAPSDLREWTSRADIARFVRKLRPVQYPAGLIRIGGERDGGYMLPDDLNGIGWCFSPGVGVSSRFEKELARRGTRSFMIDGSVDAPADPVAGSVFQKLFLGPDGDGFISLDRWVRTSLPGDSGGDLMLQMDIEGDEYWTMLFSSPETMRRFRIILIELHNLDQLKYGALFSNINEAVRRLLKDFIVVHIHPNNCCGTEMIQGVAIPRVLEVTLLRKDRDQGGAYVTTLPHPQDRDNVPGMPPLLLDPEFYSRAAT
jgi:hypothetical protein